MGGSTSLNCLGDNSFEQKSLKTTQNFNDKVAKGTTGGLQKIGRSSFDNSLVDSVDYTITTVGRRSIDHSEIGTPSLNPQSPDTIPSRKRTGRASFDNSEITTVKEEAGTSNGNNLEETKS